MTALTDLQQPTQLKHRPSRDSLIYQVWGQGPSARYDELAAQFRPVFEKIQASANEREKNRALLIELAQADANLPQALRVHFGFTEDLLLSSNEGFKALWLARIGNGETVGSAWSEGGKESIDQFSTRLSRQSDGAAVLNGEKYYTTGSLYAEWIDVGITDLDGNSASILIPRGAAGVSVLDDWNGFGQVLTASGTAVFENVQINPADVLPDDSRFKYSAAFYQLIQLSIIAGLTRAAAYDLSALVEKRSRNYSHANSALVRHDPQILQVAGKIRGAAYTSAAIIEKNAQALQRAYEAAFASSEALESDQNAIAELEIAQSQTIITDLALNASTIMFDALGASATDKNLALDRYWRNIRTLASHTKTALPEISA